MKLPVLKGERVSLRTIMASDIEDRLKMGRHNEFVHMCGGDSFIEAEYPDRAAWESWYENQKKEECAFIIDLAGHCIGGARFHHISAADKRATYAVGIFDPTMYSKGIGTEVTGLMLKFGFEELKLHRIDLKVLNYNKRGIRCYEKCGFKVDGILRENAFIDGQYVSDIVMSILEDEYESLMNDKRESKQKG